MGATDKMTVGSFNVDSDGYLRSEGSFGNFSVAATGGASAPALEATGGAAQVKITSAAGVTWSREHTEVSGSLATDGDTTTISGLDVPDGSTIIAFRFGLDTEAAGIDSTTGTLTMTGGSTQELGTCSAFTAGTTISSPAVSYAVSGSAGNATFVLSGGADDTPSGGTYTFTVFYARITEAS